QMATMVTPPASLADVEALPAELARALGDPLRWRIIELLSTEQLCVAHLAEELDTAQPLVSHHLKVLRQAGVIEADRYRYWTYYRLRPGALVRLAATLGLVARSAPSGTACRRLVPGADPASPVPARPAVPRGGRPMPFRAHPMDPISRQTSPRSRCAPRRPAHALPRPANGPDQPPALRPLHRGPGRGVPRHLLAGDRGA